MRIYSRQPVEDRFWRFVVRTDDGCWRWTGATNNRGYGRLKTVDGQVYAHRLSWEIHRGLIPDGLFVMHKCDNPPCANPDHLMLGTHADNMADATTKGRMLARPNRPRGEAVRTSKLTATEVEEIRRLRGAGASRGEVAGRYGIAVNHVTQITTRRMWAHV